MKKFYMVVQDEKTLWFTGETEKQLDCFLQYMIDSIRPDADLASFEVWEADRMVMEPGASHIEKTPLDVVLNRKGIAKRDFWERMTS